MVVTNRQKFNKKYGFPLNASHSINEISKLSGVSMSILNEVKKRGMGARRTNPSSVRNLQGQKGVGGTKMSAVQWGIARVYSFVMNGKTRKTADKDLWQKHLKKKKSM